MSNNPDVAESAGASRRDGLGVATAVEHAGLALSVSGPVEQAQRRARKAVEARLAGDEATAVEYFREAIGLALPELDQAPAAFCDARVLVAQWALDCGEVALARRLINELPDPADAGRTAIGSQITDVEAWPDAWLVAAVRRDPPDEEALDVLVRRYWKPLFGRCQMLTMRREAAADLAQDTWCRVLRARERLRPGGNFRAYLLLIATNLWRDSQRSALRAGNLAEHRLASLEGEVSVGEGAAVTLAEVLPDLAQLAAADRERLKSDLDHALQRMAALSRDVLVARFLDGDSCADIARRYGKTEQTANGWVRRALSEMKLCLEDLRRGAQ